MKVKAIANRTLMGEYGRVRQGEEITLNEKHAKELEKKGAITIIGDTEDEPTKEKEGSFTITDNTGKNKEKAEEDTDEKNPVKKEKNEKAGPGKIKKK